VYRSSAKACSNAKGVSALLFKKVADKYLVITTGFNLLCSTICRDICPLNSVINSGGTAEVPDAGSTTIAGKVSGKASYLSESINELPIFLDTSDMLSGDIGNEVDIQGFHNVTISLWIVLWMVGFLLCSIYFIIAYRRGIKKFKREMFLPSGATLIWWAYRLLSKKGV